MAITIKSVYDAPKSGEGVRILVDRVWSRGLSKEKAAVDSGSRKSPLPTHCDNGTGPVSEVIDHLAANGIQQSVGVRAPILSAYFRDPDGSLIEMANYPAIFAPPPTSSH